MPKRKGNYSPRLIDNRNRVALPHAVLRALKAGPGDYVDFEVGEEGEVRLFRLNLSRVMP